MNITNNKQEMLKEFERLKREYYKSKKEYYKQLDDAERFVFLEQELNEKIEEKLEKNTKIILSAIQKSEQSLLTHIKSLVATTEENILNTFKIAMEKMDESDKKDMNEIISHYRSINKVATQTDDAELLDFSTQLSNTIIEELRTIILGHDSMQDANHRRTKQAFKDELTELKKYLKELTHEIHKEQWRLHYQTKKKLEEIEWRIKKRGMTL